jgi:hypothetical protein
MSTVLWANVLVGTDVKSDETDRYALYKHGDKLDAISRQLGLPSFNGICDTTDLRFNTDDSLELPEGMTSTNELMAREGAWLNARDAVSTLERLLGHIRDHRVRFGLLSNQHEEVVEELEEVLAFLRREGADAAKFNFSVVM